jgi:uracil-DNA glycosylase
MGFNLRAVKPGWQSFFSKNAELVSAIECSVYEWGEHGVLPAPGLVFRAFETVDVMDFSVLILGQDPYPHEAACGLCFSTAPESKVPASLKNMLLELNAPDYFIREFDGDLSGWSANVLMINAALTVMRGAAGSHQRLWREFTRRLIRYCSQNNPFFVFLSWGRQAHNYSELVSDKHAVIKTSHPSPLGVTKSGEGYSSFRGSDCFERANQELERHNRPRVDWLALLSK